MEIIVEVLGRHGRVSERIKCRSTRIGIGRSYRNDVILADPYVCPQHLELVFDTDSGHWKVQDVSSQNGSFQVGHGRLTQPQKLQSGDEFDLGETRVRLLLPEHEIAATRALPSGRMLADYFALPIVAIALLVITLGLFAFAQYLSQGTEIKLQELLLEALMFLAVPFVWASVWGMIGRVAVHEVRFGFHLSMGSLLVILVFIVSVLSDFLAFGFSNETLSVWLENGGEGILLCAFLLVSLWTATNLGRLARWILANGLAWGLVGVGLLAWVVNSDPYETQGQEVYRLKPPFARLQPAVTLDDFMTSAEEAFAELDQDFQDQKAKESKQAVQNPENPAPKLSDQDSAAKT